MELQVNMHCEACAEQLKEKILKMRGNQTAFHIQLSCSSFIFIHICLEEIKGLIKSAGVQNAVTDHNSGKVTVTGTMDGDKLVDYVYRRTRKQAKIVPQPEPEPEKKEEAAAEKPAEEAKPEEKKEENAEKKEEEKPAEEAKKEEEGGAGGGEKEEHNNDVVQGIPEEELKRMMQHYYQPLYVYERIPPPQLFSDENPNACCIS